MKLSEHIISIENGTEYFNIFFEVSNKTDLTLQEYKNIENFIYEKLTEIEDEKIKNNL